jgi:hypothetical protein
MSVKLREPMVIRRFVKNNKGEFVEGVLKEYGGKLIFDLRSHFTDRAGKTSPSKKGLALLVDKLPELHRTVAEAEKVARELGLLDHESEAVE